MEGSLRTGIPDGEDVNAAAAPAPAHCLPQTDASRAVNPAHYGPKYDEIHETVVKNAPKALREWHAAKDKLEIVMATYKGIAIAEAMRTQLQAIIDEVDKLTSNISKTRHTIEVKHKGFLSEEQLRECKSQCEESAAKAKQGSDLAKLVKGATELGKKKG